MDTMNNYYDTIKAGWDAGDSEFIVMGPQYFGTRWRREDDGLYGGGHAATDHRHRYYFDGDLAALLAHGTLLD